jgi:FlaA1/EpsC-like NDP-sugar epimerase
MFTNEEVLDYASIYEGKNILITGSVGTVGSEMLKQILALKPSEIRLFDNNESGLFMQYQTYKNGTKIIPVMGDIRDGGKLSSAMEGIDIVFHLAAYKHVEMCEHNPFDAVRTNVIGTQNVLKTALNQKVKRVLYTSSDKAVNPTNVMGTSKLLAERVVTASCLKRFNGCKQLIFSSTRFGNVLGSNGSVVPVFIDQIRRGGPVTVTDIRMTRFIMTVQEAAALVIKGAALACGGEVFVTKMPVVRIIDLANAMIELLAPFYGYLPESILVEFVGSKPGEKMYEELMSEEETIRAAELEDMFSILPALLHNGDAKNYIYPGFISGKVTNPYISRSEIPMTKKEIKNYLLSNSVLGEDITKAINNNGKDHYHLEVAYKE